ncbi:MAG: hypothetical protein FJX65_11710 [Alphaproteobacteria bacterium]|nr:hypothetical protein [Alphaproteobacteria bacterium]
MRRDRAESYEVHTEVDGRTAIDSVFNDRASALAAAQALVASRRYDAVRVLQERRVGRPAVLFEQSVARKGPTLGAGEISTAPLCRTLDDYFAFPARRAAGQVLRTFFTHRRLPPFEVVHTLAELCALTGFEDLIVQAANRVARMQARQSKLDAIDRAEELMGLPDQMIEALREVGDVGPVADALRRDGLAAAQAVAARSFKAHAARAVGIAVAHQLAAHDDWG